MGHDYRSRIEDTIDCEIELTSPIFKSLLRNMTPVLSGYSVLVSVSETYIEFHEKKSDSSKGVQDGAKDGTNMDESKGLYPWVSNFQLKEVNTAEPILVLERSDCTEKGNFFIVSEGRLLDEQRNELRDKLNIVRSKIYAANHYYGESGDSYSRQVVENSVDPTHYWCIPKKEFCYREIDFGKFGINVKQNQAEDVDSRRVYSLRLGIVSALQLIAVESCSIETN